MNADKPIRLDCSYADEHAEHHLEHPKTGRLVCMKCHPIPNYEELKAQYGQTA